MSFETAATLVTISVDLVADKPAYCAAQYVNGARDRMTALLLDRAVKEERTFTYAKSPKPKDWRPHANAFWSTAQPDSRQKLMRVECMVDVTLLGDLTYVAAVCHAAGTAVCDLVLTDETWSDH